MRRPYLNDGEKMNAVANAGYLWSVEHSPELDKYGGRWVALGDKGVIAVKATLKELMKEADVKKAHPFVTRILTKEEATSFIL